MGNSSGEPAVLTVEAAYDRWAATYDGYDNPMVFAATQAMAALEGVAGADVVEFGCGTGRNLQLMADRGAASLTGLDLSDGMLARARARNPAFRLLRHDMREAAPVADASADLAVFCLTLEHVEDIARPVAEAARVLRPGGRLVAVEIHPFLAMSGIAAHFKDAAGEVRMPAFAHRFSDYVSAFVGAGLVITSCREWRPRDFAGPVPEKALKRGPDMPLAIEFQAVLPA